MTKTVRSSVSQLRTVPPLTACTIGFSLLALPAFALLAETLPMDLSLAAELVIQWGVAAIVVGAAVAIENRSFAAIGFRRPAWVDIGYLLGTSVVTLVVFVLTDPLVSALGLPVGDDAGTLATDVGLELALMGAVTTGVVEEILFRGYPIERLLEYTDSRLVAGGLTWLAFTVAHTVVWPLENLLQIAAVAAVLTLVYLRRRTLVPVIGAHVLVWMVAVLGQFYG